MYNRHYLFKFHIQRKMEHDCHIWAIAAQSLLFFLCVIASVRLTCRLENNLNSFESFKGEKSEQYSTSSYMAVTF